MLQQEDNKYNTSILQYKNGEWAEVSIEELVVSDINSPSMRLTIDKDWDKRPAEESIFARALAKTKSLFEK